MWGQNLEEAMLVYISKREIGYDGELMLIALHFFVMLIISAQKLMQVIKSNTVGFLRIQKQQENTKENAKKYTEINWDWSKTISWYVKCYCSLLADFRNGNKNVKTFLKGEEILLLFRKFYWKIGRKLIISYSNKMQLW